MTNEGTDFILEHVWDVVRHSPKWRMIPPPCSSKRSKTSDSKSQSDAQTTTIKLNDPLSEDENEVEFEEPRRPIGKKERKNDRFFEFVGWFKRGNWETSHKYWRFPKWHSRFQRSISRGKQKKWITRIKRHAKAFAYLRISEEGLEGIDIWILRRTKYKIREKWGFDN